MMIILNDKIVSIALHRLSTERLKSLLESVIIGRQDTQILK